jgi:Protein of unknown function (DUF3147)
MLIELVFRFIVGGLVVCAFAVIGDLFRPKSFGGIFGAAPSVALATLGLTLYTHGGSYTSLEGRSMIIGAMALFGYSLLARWLILKGKVNVLPAAAAAMAGWFLIAFGIWGAALR